MDLLELGLQIAVSFMACQMTTGNGPWVLSKSSTLIQSSLQPFFPSAFDIEILSPSSRSASFVLQASGWERITCVEYLWTVLEHLIPGWRCCLWNLKWGGQLEVGCCRRIFHARVPARILLSTYQREQSFIRPFSWIQLSSVNGMNLSKSQATAPSSSELVLLTKLPHSFVWIGDLLTCTQYTKCVLVPTEAESVEFPMIRITELWGEVAGN